jgi:PAS domain S-box-containing protein
MNLFKGKFFSNMVTKTVSLAQRILLAMGGRIAFIAVTVTLVSYWHIESILENQMLEQLTKYIGERGQYESSQFKLAEDNHFSFREEFLKRYQDQHKQFDKTQFEQFFVKHEDNTIRLHNKFYFGDETTSQQHLSGFIEKEVNITEEFKRRLLLSYEMLQQYAPPWLNRFENLYVSYPEGAAVTYWPNEPWGIKAPADLKVNKEEWVYIADEEHNPARKTVWTGLYYDKIAKDYMVSAETPIYLQNRLLLTVGHDIRLNDLMNRTLNNRLEGSYNILLRKDGRLIAHPNLMLDIQKKEGNLFAQKTNNAELIHIFELLQQKKAPTEIILDKENDNFLAVTELLGTEWNLITVYPKKLLAYQAFLTARFILLIGIISLVIEILMLFFVLKKQITSPLKDFTSVTEQLAHGNFDGYSLDALPLQRQDEIGKLAQSFHIMADQLKAAFNHLAAKNYQLQENEKRYRTLFESANDAILILKDDTFIDCNLKALEIFACEKEWIVGHTPFHLSPFYQENGNDSKAQGLDYIYKTLNGESQFFEWMHYRKNKEIFNAEVSLNRVFFNNTNHIQVVVRDVTERKQAEQNRINLIKEQEAKDSALRYSHEIELKNQALIQLNQDKNEFLGIAAHDLKNPLSGILGLAQIMKESPEMLSSKEIAEYSQMIETSSEQMFNLVTNLLDVNKIESGKFELKMEQCDLLPLISSVLHNYKQRAAAKNIQLCFEEQHQTAWLDKNITLQILDNLVSNAIKYSPLEKTVFIRLKTTEYSVRCEIKDQGLGLSEADQQKLFGKFTRLSTKPTAGEHSTGLGLFIVKKLVEAMQAKIWCESTQGKGATFIVEFANKEST